MATTERVTENTSLPGPGAMRAVLDELADKGRVLLKQRSARRAAESGLRSVWRLMPLIPVGFLLVQGGQALAGASVWTPSAALVLTLTLCVPLLWLGFAVGRAWAEPVDRTRALALFDRAAGARERLVGADALLAQAGTSGFVDAALEDAARFLGRARVARPQLSDPRVPRQSIALLSGALTLLLAGLVLSLGSPAPVAEESEEATVLVGRTSVPTAGSTQEQRPDENEAATPGAGKQRSGAPPAADPARRGESDAETLPDEERKKEGQTGSGRPSQAETSRGAGDARGSPTSQGQESKKPEGKRKMKPATKRKPSRQDPQPDGEKTEGEESGSTSGRGSSRGSNKNPVTSDWTSKDQVTTDEDEDVEDDDEVEDEEVDSEARGGVQPSLRDRRPPVSRDLSIGFSNRPSPNANGRGGASPPKKSRGTASLVLGVPIPDRIKGRANPGKTKVTQERVEPRAEGAAPISAESRAPRAGPTTELRQPVLEPWMRNLIRDYFLRLRQADGGAIPTSVGAKDPKK